MYTLPRSLSNSTIPMLSFDDGDKHIEFEFFKDKIEVFYLNRKTDESYDVDLEFPDKLKEIVNN